MKKFLYLTLVLISLIFFGCSNDEDNCVDVNELPTVTDIDGNVYHIVTIGTQEWMVENLNTTRYRNGDSILLITDSIAWEANDSTTKTGAYCNFDNDENNATIYGRMYNWYAVNDSRSIAPTGWHMPTWDEYETLINYLGGYNDAGGFMKAMILWDSPNKGANNCHGFSGLPGGFRNYYGNFKYIGSYGAYWSTTEWQPNSYNANHIYLKSYASYVERDITWKNFGFSCRCIKD